MPILRVVHVEVASNCRSREGVVGFRGTSGCPPFHLTDGSRAYCNHATF